MMHAFDAVDCVKRWMGMENDLAVTVDRAPADGKQLFDVRLLDLMTAQFDLYVGDVADETPSSKACPHIVDRNAGNAFGDFDSLTDRNLARLHVSHIAALDPSA